eukprot:COSAG05_NODE_3672_length_1915_cov_1.610132_4_plen_41_part_01
MTVPWTNQGPAGPARTAPERAAIPLTDQRLSAVFSCQYDRP